MKRLLKKLVAGAMAGAMALGMVVTAGASSTGGQYTGTGGLETVKPNSAMTVVVPTYDNNDLNMILDPHGMIALTEGEAWNDGAGRVPTFAADTNVFFRNKVTNTTAKEVSTNVTLDGVAAKARLFKKVVFPTTDTIIYGTQGANPNFYADLSGTAVSGTYAACDETTDSVTSGTTYAWKTGKTATATISSTETLVDEYKVATSVTMLYLFEGETTDKNFASSAATALTPAYATANSGTTTEVAGLSGKDIATITNETNGYKPVVRALTAYDYSANTDDLKVINKSYAPLTVRVQAELSKQAATAGDPDANVTLVDDPAKLVNTKDGKATNPLMYLALVNSAAEDPVVLKDPAAAEIDDDTGEITAYVVGKPNVIRDFTSADLTPTAVKNLDLIKGQPEFEWIDDEDETIKNALNDKLNNYAAAYPTSGSATPTNFQILYTAATKTFSVSALANQVSGGSYTLELELQDEDADDPTKVVAEGSDIPVYVNILSGSDVVARISMVLDGLKAGLLTQDVVATPASGTANKGPAVNIVKWETKSEAESTAILPMFASGFKPVADTTANGYNQTSIQNSTLSASGAAYSYVLRDGVPDSRFSAAKFHLNAGINTVDAWDLAHAQNLKLKLIYNVNLYNESDGDLPEDEEPSVTVVTPGTDAAVTALMNVTLGTGNSSYDEVTAVKYVNAEGAAKTVGASDFTFDADALTVTVKYAISSTKNMVGSTGWTMTFKNTLTNETKDVAFDIHTAS